MNSRLTELGLVQCKTIALDFGGALSSDREDHVIAQRGVDPQAAAALHDLARLGMRLVLANATASETRWPALQLAGLTGCSRWR